MNLNLPSIPSTDPIHENWYLPSRRTRRRRWRHGRTSIGAMPHYSCYSIHSINIHIGSYGAAPWWKQSCTFTPLTSQVARTQIVIHWCDRWCYWTYWTPFRVKQRWTPWLLYYLLRLWWWRAATMAMMHLHRSVDGKLSPVPTAARASMQCGGVQLLGLVTPYPRRRRWRWIVLHQIVHGSRRFCVQ